jgi:methylase of polypeptide subunit release factors
MATKRQHTVAGLMGGEPSIDHLDPKESNYTADIMRLFNWYSSEKKRTDSYKFHLDFVKNNRSKDDFKIFSTIDEKVRIVEGDVSDVLIGVKCDLVIANPPYIPDSQALPRDVAGFEPHVALFGGPTGMEIPRQFIAAAARLLKSEGVLVIEHTEAQGIDIANELLNDFENIVLHRDLNDRPRWTSAVRK